MGRRVLVPLCAALILSGCAGIPGAEGKPVPSIPGSDKVLAPTRPGPPTTTPAPVPEVACLEEIENSYQRPYADTAPWNVPVCGLDEDPRSADWAYRFWHFSRLNLHMAGNPTKSNQLGKFEVMFGLDDDPNRDFSVAVYSTADATTTARVFKRGGWPGKFNVPSPTSIPWNPAWRASTGSDAMMVILDPTTGSQWSLWGLAQSVYGLPVNDTQCWGDIASFWLPGGGFRPGIDLCSGGLDRVVKAGSTTLADYRTYGGNNPKTRGVGVDRFAMLVTPEEVATGRIRHALQMPVYNTMTGGAICTEAQAATAAFGSTCGHSLAPAGNFEAGSSDTKGCGEPVTEQLTTDQYRQTTLPQGMRFALKKTPAEIEQWLDSRGYTGQKRITARAFATALVEYGWFVTDTTCSAANFQVAGASNAKTGTAWRALGVTGDGRDLLQGFITQDRIWTVEAPINHCVDGTRSKLACPATKVLYD